MPTTVVTRSPMNFRAWSFSMASSGHGVPGSEVSERQLTIPVRARAWAGRAKRSPEEWSG